MRAQINRDLRRYVRILPKHIVECKKILVPGINDPEIAYCQIANLKANGLVIASKEKYEVDMLLRLKIDVSGWEECLREEKHNKFMAPIVAIVRIIFVELCIDGTYDIGMHLIGIRGNDQMGLVHYIYNWIEEAC